MMKGIRQALRSALSEICTTTKLQSHRLSCQVYEGCTSDTLSSTDKFAFSLKNRIEQIEQSVI